MRWLLAPISHFEYQHPSKFYHLKKLPSSNLKMCFYFGAQVHTLVKLLHDIMAEKTLSSALSDLMVLRKLARIQQ